MTPYTIILPSMIITSRHFRVAVYACVLYIKKKTWFLKKIMLGRGEKFAMVSNPDGSISFFDNTSTFVNVEKNQSKDQEDDNEQSDRLSNGSTNLSM